MRERVILENVRHAGRSRRPTLRITGLRKMMLAVLPDAPPGLTVAFQSRMLPRLPRGLFPGGAKAGWWLEAVQVDLEAKGVVLRERTRPLRLRKV